MSKKVTFAPKPVPVAPVNADAWVSGTSTHAEATPKTELAEKMKRFTFDVPETLHRRVKARCAEKGVDMADEMRRILMDHFPSS